MGKDYEFFDENKADALYLKDLLKYDFLFLDIKLENKNGIEMGIQIKDTREGTIFEKIN